MIKEQIEELYNKEIHSGVILSIEAAAYLLEELDKSPLEPLKRYKGIPLKISSKQKEPVICQKM